MKGSTKVSKLELHDYSFSYDRSNDFILKDINFALSKGDFVCLCGPNGSGKSTLLNCLYDGFKCKNQKDKARSVSFLSQSEVPLWDYSVYDTVLQGRFCHTGALNIYSKEDYDFTRKIIQDFSLENIMEKSIKEISGGEFQKTRIARSFAQDADFLLLDEPLSSLDFVVSDKLMELLKKKSQTFNKGVIISIHDINTASRFADKVLLLGPCKYGKQFFKLGTVKEVFTEENLSRAYCSTVKVYDHPVSGVPQV